MSYRLSASTIKYINSDIYKFIIKFTEYYTDVEEFSEHLVLWHALHKIAEHYNKTWIVSAEEWEKDAMESLSKYEEWVDYTQAHIDAILSGIKYWAENIALNLDNITIWMAELLITLDTVAKDVPFVWYIDKLDKINNIIEDYKFVGKPYICANWMFDPVPWYIIQMLLYGLWYHKEFKTYPTVRVVEILKWDTLIAEAWYLKKDFILGLCPKDANAKLTREKLIETYSPRLCWCTVIERTINDDMLNLASDILDASAKVVEKILQKDVAWLKPFVNDAKRAINKACEYFWQRSIIPERNNKSFTTNKIEWATKQPLSDQQIDSPKESIQGSLF